MSAGNGTTQALRAELAAVDPGAACCVKAELATLLAGAAIRDDQAEPEYRKVALPGAGLARRVAALLERESRRGHVAARGRRVEIAVQRKMLDELLGRGNPWVSLLERVVRRRCCLTAHLRALVVAGAHLVNPGRGYHLEVVLPPEYPGPRLLAATHARSLPFHLVVRRGRTVLYLKAWEEISMVLGQLGAVGTMLSFEEVTIERRMRENINRAVNGEVSNLSRASGAAANQLDAIQWLEQNHLLEALPERLREVAALRLAHPHDDLATLATRSTGLSRSGLFHRLRDLVAATRDLKAGAGRAANGVARTRPRRPSVPSRRRDS